MGQGPALLLVHGTGASTHSWRDLAPLLAEHFWVIAPDLPGHGFTDPLPARRLSLPGMAGALRDLLEVLEARPAVAAGHSAGAALLIRMSLDGAMKPAGLVSLNGALLPFRGIAAQVFSPLAKLLFNNPLVPRIFARSAAGEGPVERLVRNTGSVLDRRGVELYARLVRSPAHVAGALGMMANWDLDPIERDLPRLAPKLLLVAGGNDRAIPPEDAFRARDLLPGAAVHYMRGLGHLAHEERPAEVAALIVGFARSCGVLPES